MIRASTIHSLGASSCLPYQYVNVSSTVYAGHTSRAQDQLSEHAKGGTRALAWDLIISAVWLRKQIGVTISPRRWQREHQIHSWIKWQPLQTGYYSRPLPCKRVVEVGPWNTIPTRAVCAETTKIAPIKLQQVRTDVACSMTVLKQTVELQF